MKCRNHKGKDIEDVNFLSVGYWPPVKKKTSVRLVANWKQSRSQ